MPKTTRPNARSDEQRPDEERPANQPAGSARGKHTDASQREYAHGTPETATPVTAGAHAEQSHAEQSHAEHSHAEQGHAEQSHTEESAGSEPFLTGMRFDRGLMSAEADRQVARFERGNEVTHYGLSVVLSDIDERRLYLEFSHPDTQTYAYVRHGIEPRRTREYIRVGRALFHLPNIENLFRSGELIWSKVLELVRVAKPEHEQAWIQRARESTVKQLRVEVKLARDNGAPRARGDRRGLPALKRRWTAAIDPLTNEMIELTHRKLADERGAPLSGDELMRALCELVLGSDEAGDIPGRERVDASLYRINVRRERIAASETGSQGCCANCTPESSASEQDGEYDDAHRRSFAIHVDDPDAPAQPSAANPSAANPDDASSQHASTKDGDASGTEARGEGQGGTASDYVIVLETDDVDVPLGGPEGARVACMTADAELVLPDGQIAPKTSQALRARVLRRDKHRCRCCNTWRGLTAHHVIFRSRSGITDIANLVALCGTCHQLLHDRKIYARGKDVLHLEFYNEHGALITAARRAEILRTRAPGGMMLAKRDVKHASNTGLHLVGGSSDADWSSSRELADSARLANGAEQGSPPVKLGFEEAFRDVLGQDELLRRLRHTSEGADALGDPYPHTLFWGPPGTGKTTLARALAAFRGTRLHATSGPLLKDPDVLPRLLGGFRQDDLLFIDEIHAVPTPVLEVLYEALTANRISHVTEAGGRPADGTLQIPRFTLLAATTEPGTLPKPLRSRFGEIEGLHFHDTDQLAEIAIHRARGRDFELSMDLATQIGTFSRGTPRETIRLVDATLRCAAREHAQQEQDDSIRQILPWHVEQLRRNLGLDENGLRPEEQRYLAILEQSAEPVPLGRLAELLGSDMETVRRTIEPHLFVSGYVQTTSRGRALAERRSTNGLSVAADAGGRPAESAWLVSEGVSGLGAQLTGSSVSITPSMTSRDCRTHGRAIYRVSNAHLAADARRGSSPRPRPRPARLRCRDRSGRATRDSPSRC